jgi:hypothetical protein
MGGLVVDRRITKAEFAEAEESLHRHGLTKGWIQYLE